MGNKITTLTGVVPFKKMRNLQETKLKWFQIRLVHGILATNIVLMYMDNENDINCSFCRRERGYQSRFLLYLKINKLRCVYIKSFWKQFHTALSTWSSNALTVTLYENVVLSGNDGHFKSDSTFDLIILRKKFCIYTCKINNNMIHELYLFQRYLNIHLM